MTDYLQKEEFLTDSGEVRHVILSEIGYTSSQGQDLQAASFVYAYKVIEANQYIDSMLFSRETDHKRSNRCQIFRTGRIGRIKSIIWCISAGTRKRMNQIPCIIGYIIQNNGRRRDALIRQR